MRLLKPVICAVAAGSLSLLLYAGETSVKPKANPAPASPLSLIPEADRKLPRDNNYVVHEWGTFTSFSGSDGVSLDFRPLVDEDLPQFVMDRPRQAALNARRDIAYRTGVGVKGVVISKQRMETPVTYFYTDQERIVDVSVDFPEGLLTEFFPPVRQFGPEYKKDSPEILAKSFLRWGNVRLIPEYKALNEKGVDPYIPKIADKENPHYAYARETDSAHVQITDPAMLATYREKFLFYRGLGNFTLPVSVNSSAGGHFTLNYTDKTPLHYAFLVQVDGDNLRFARYDQITQATQMSLPAQPSTLDALAEDVTRALVSDGLFDKEAKAMVKTWKSSWFGEQGTRIFYSLPQSDTDILLPLHLNPAPRELIRVMIGRYEILTPERQQKIESLISQLGAEDIATRDRCSAELKKMGRFAEPALTKVASTTADPEVQIRAQLLLREILASKGIPTNKEK